MHEFSREDLKTFQASGLMVPEGGKRMFPGDLTGAEASS